MEDGADGESGVAFEVVEVSSAANGAAVVVVDVVVPSTSMQTNK